MRQRIAHWPEFSSWERGRSCRATGARHRTQWRSRRSSTWLRRMTHAYECWSIVSSRAKRRQCTSHPGYVVYFFGPGRLGVTFGDGKTTESTVTEGEVVVRDPLSHAVENIGTTEVHALLVELKGPVRQETTDLVPTAQQPVAGDGGRVGRFVGTPGWACAHRA
jgi:hypothetical protein